MKFDAIIDLLRCPVCRGNLTEEPDGIYCQRDGQHHYPIINDVIRFAGITKTAYNAHWHNYAGRIPSATKLTQAEHFMRWFLNDTRVVHDKPVILDMGCGDGNHIPYTPNNALKIAVDYSGSVEIVRHRYKDTPNLFVIQADAAAIPLRDSCVDHYIAYGCLNCMREMAHGIHEMERVLVPGGSAALWGFGTNNALVRNGLSMVRAMHKKIPVRFLRKAFVFSLIPSLWIVNNSTQIRLGKNTLRECFEIISTNLSPDYLHVFGKDTWCDYCSKTLMLVDEYELSCGQKFIKQS